MKRWMLMILLGMGLCPTAWAQVPETPMLDAAPETALDVARSATPSAPADTVEVAGDGEVCETPCMALPTVACRRCPRVWGSAEFLLWTMKDAPLPTPLLVAGPGVANLTPVLGAPMQTVAMGAQDVSLNMRSGGRFTLGYWGEDDDWGTSITYFFLGNASAGKIVGSTGAPGSAGLAIPFIDANTGLESSTRVAFPGGFAGAAGLDVANDLQGWEWNGLYRIGDRDRLRFHLLGGFRYLNFVERLTFNTSSPSIVPPPDVFVTRDEFDCRNYFYGAQFGGQAEFRRNRLLLRAQTKVALGAMYEVVMRGGQLVTNDFNGFGAPQVFPAGYLVGPTNAGKSATTRFAVIPEVDLNVGYQLTRRATFLIGWSFLYASNVVRPGDQIDRTINPSQFPSITGVPTTTVVGAARPAQQTSSNDFWAQGMNFALQFNY